jgi:hypothetical protein
MQTSRARVEQIQVSIRNVGRRTDRGEDGVDARVVVRLGAED